MIVTNEFLNLILSVLLFPTYFQAEFIRFAWGVSDPVWVMLLKRTLLLLPVFSFIIACWISIISSLTVLFRQNRRQFITTLIITWWDLGKSILSFWGGIISFLLQLGSAITGLLRVTVLGLWGVIQEILFFPFRLLKEIFRSMGRSSIPWIAVTLILFWCLVEAVIFTYVTTPLVMDTFSNITGEYFAENLIRIPLFIFLFFVVLGSYAVLSTFVDVIQKKDYAAIIGIGVIEIIVLFVEVVFLYREFVDALVPWFAQYSENFELGIFWTLAISSFAWFGIRSLSWVLFAAHGTPTVMKIIQGKHQVTPDKPVQPAVNQKESYSNVHLSALKNSSEWVKEKSEELIHAFMLPPLQIVAATVNFVVLLVSGHHLFELPLTHFDQVVDSGQLLNKVGKEKKAPSQVQIAGENV